MPRETVQYPSTRWPNPTEVSVRWGKESAHVQLEIERHDFLKCPSGCTDANERALNLAARTGVSPAQVGLQGCTDCPPQGDPIPIGSVRISDDGHIARKDDDGSWNIWRREGGMEVVDDDQIQDWPLVWKPEGGVCASTIFTEVFERQHLNKMIRVLRRARDDAYGADA